MEERKKNAHFPIVTVSRESEFLNRKATCEKLSHIKQLTFNTIHAFAAV
jgi:hypothetical protein